MNTEKENPFLLPIKQTGIDKAEVISCGLWIVFTAMAVILLLAAVAVYLLRGGAVLPGPFFKRLLKDLAFGLVRQPETFLALINFYLDKAVPGRILFFSGGLLVFVLAAGRQLTKAVALMTDHLSSGEGSVSPRGALLASGGLLFFVCAGAVLLKVLGDQSDTWTLFIIRLLALGFLVQILCMVLGGAVACAQAENQPAGQAFRRMVRLSWRLRGHFMRAAVYSLPRWAINGFLNWFILRTAMILPLILSLWFLTKIPFKANFIDRTLPWFSNILPAVMEPQSFLSAWQTTACVILIGIFLTTQCAGILGLWLFLYPTAIGVCTFFFLRYEAEGKAYLSREDESKASRWGIATPGAALFTSGGRSAWGRVKPPRGWLALTWAPLQPRILLGAAGWLLIFFGWAAWVGRLSSGAWQNFVIIVGFFGALTLGLNLAAGGAIAFLSRQTPRMTPSNFIFRLWLLFTPWAVLVFFLIALVALMAIGGSLALIPGLGPILWGILYIALFMGATICVAFLLHWLPACLILPVIVAGDPGRAPRPMEIFKRVVHYGNAAPWTFLGALAMGLPFALAPGLIGLTLYTISPFPDFSPNVVELLLGPGMVTGIDLLKALAGSLVLSLSLAGVASAVTNAYFIVRETAGEPPSS